MPGVNGTVMSAADMKRVASAPRFTAPSGMGGGHTIVAPMVQIGPDASGMLSDQWRQNLNRQLKAVHDSAVLQAGRNAGRNFAGYQAAGRKGFKL